MSGINSLLARHTAIVTSTAGGIGLELGDVLVDRSGMVARVGVIFVERFAGGSAGQVANRSIAI